MRPYYTDDAVTLYLGDSREIVPTLPDASVDFIFTDPPYGHKNNDGDLAHNWEAALGRGVNTVEDARPIANDGPEANDLVRWLFAQSKRLLRHGGCCCCCCCGGGPDPQFARWSLWLDEALGFKHAIVWDKLGLGLGWHYRRSYEMVLVGQKPGGPCKWYGGTNVSNVLPLRSIIPQRDQHPTEKPVALPGWFIHLHSEPGDLVLDPFAGAGSTLIAAKERGRKAIGVECDERWAEMAATKLRDVREQRCLIQATQRPDKIPNGPRLPVEPSGAE